MFKWLGRLELDKKLSLVIAVGYLALACFSEDVVVTVLKLLMFLAAPLGCIWFSDEFGACTVVLFSRPSITKETPGVFIWFMGWVLLLLPFILVSISLIDRLWSRKGS